MDAHHHMDSDPKTRTQGSSTVGKIAIKIPTLSAATPLLSALPPRVIAKAVRPPLVRSPILTRSRSMIMKLSEKWKTNTDVSSRTKRAEKRSASSSSGPSVKRLKSARANNKKHLRKILNFYIAI